LNLLLWKLSLDESVLQKKQKELPTVSHCFV
jgi:hypothetical protein